MHELAWERLQIALAAIRRVGSRARVEGRLHA